MTRYMRLIARKTLVILSLLLLAGPAFAQENRYVIIDQDAAGPGGTDMMSILLLLQSPNVTTLGITVVTGDAWRDEEVAHTLRLLELVGRTDIPVAPGAVFPLVRTQPATQLWERQFGRVAYQAPGPAAQTATVRLRCRHWRKQIPPPSHWTKTPLTSWCGWFTSFRTRLPSMPAGP